MTRLAWSQFAAGLAGALLFGPPASRISAQTLLSSVGNAVRLVGSDMAVLETQEVRKDIDCTVAPEKPTLGFDLRFHAGFNVTVPLKEMAGASNLLRVLLRVTPLDRGSDPTYLVQHFRVPEVAEGTGGSVLLRESLDLGEGTYHVDWMMQDNAQRVCSFYWDMEAGLSSKDREMKLAIPAGTIDATHLEQFTDEPPAPRLPDRKPLTIKLLVNLAPQGFDASTMRPEDITPLVSILRGLAREPHFGRFSVVGFNLQQQRVLYRQDAEETIDFPALGEALRAVKLGTVDAANLQRKHGDTEFLTDLLQSELGSDDQPDAVVIAGPKVMLDTSVPAEALKPLAEVGFPVFYMNYALDPQAIPWRDSIGRAIHAFRGTEFTVTRPRDMWFSLTDMISQILKSSRTRRLEAQSAN